VFTGSFFWSLSGLILAAVSLIFLLNDVKHGRISLISSSGTDYDNEKVVIRRERSPFLFKLIIGGVAICTAITFVTCLIVLIVKMAASIDFLNAADSGLVIVAFIPYSLVLMYVFDNISVRVFARSWDMQSEGPQTLGLSGDDKKGEIDS
jgi:hypothetical protein